MAEKPFWETRDNELTQRTNLLLIEQEARREDSMQAHRANGQRPERNARAWLTGELQRGMEGAQLESDIRDLSPGLWRQPPHLVLERLGRI